MYQQQITGKEVLEKLASYLKDEVKFTTTTLRKHRKNWESVIKFAQERNIPLDLSDADSLLIDLHLTEENSSRAIIVCHIPFS